MGRIYQLHVTPEGDPVPVEPLDGDIDHVQVADQAGDTPAIEESCRFTCGRPVVPDLVPTRLRRGARGAIPDFDNGLILNVSGRARGLIEALEPTIHQFLAVTCLDADGQWIEQRYFLIPCRRLDSLDPERSHSPGNDMAWPREAASDVAELPVQTRIVFSRARIGRAHLWHEARLAGAPFVSDSLAKALKASGMTGLAWDRVFEAL